MEWSRRSVVHNHEWPIDRDSVLDFLYYGSPFMNGGQQLAYSAAPGNPLETDLVNPCGTGYNITGKPWQASYVFERLGNIPTPKGHAREFENITWSWNNWRHGLERPNFGAGPAINAYNSFPWNRFPANELWDTWKTVPYASAKIYVPEACQLFVQAWARGTWNMVAHRPADPTDAPQPTGPIAKAWGGMDASDDAPTIFRLFVDQAHDKDSRKFAWRSNGLSYEANWAPIQNELEVGLGARGLDTAIAGREWKMSTWPTGMLRVASEIHIPAAGYYTISLRYSSEHYLGWGKWNGASYDWRRDCAPDDAPTGDVSKNVWGLNLVSRFEASGIQAVAQLKRTGNANNHTDGQFT
jgi:hypothetical protein